MPDWTASMQQSFEYWKVDPGTWKDMKRIDTVTSCSINRDLDAETLGSASIDVTESTGECYIRVYLITIQNGIRERHPLGTFLVQTPASSFNGKIMSISMDAYTPLLELKENPPPIGYNIAAKEPIMERVYMLARENVRAPVIPSNCQTRLYNDFVADTSDNWLSFLIDLAAKANQVFSLDELGRIMFAPKQELTSLQPVWTYSDGNSSLLYPDVNLDHDLYGVPNVVEVIYSDSGKYFHSIVENNDPNSPASIVNRGRRITHRVLDPDLGQIAALDDDEVVNGDITSGIVEEYAKKLLKELSSIAYTISYTHGYCPVRIGDCVRLNYPKAGINGIKAKVISQSIKCTPGCPVSETAIFTMKLWR